MMRKHKSFEKVVEFHGHVCPGLAIGYRVSRVALNEFQGRASDEELVAVVENDSCAVDAVQVMVGCTFGKGNLIFHDFGKQVYTFFERPYPEALRISLKWLPPDETEEERTMWKRFMRGDDSDDVLRVVHGRKTKKIEAILESKDEDLFEIQRRDIIPPEKARFYPSVICSMCGEKMMESRARVKAGNIVCIPCMEKNE